MPPKGKRPIMSRGRNICSVDDRKVTNAGGGGKMLLAMGAEPRAPIGKKFVRQKSAEKCEKSKMITSTVYEQWMDAVIESGIRNIRREYLDLVRSYVPSGTQRAWESDKNYDKNRYDDIRVLDDTRVVLKHTPDNEDYINASYVNVGDGMIFICAQGPMTNTIQDFWIMIVQEEVKVILQLCKFNENGKEQCAEYFPDDENCKEFGAIRVRCLEKPTNISQLKKVTRTKIQVNYDGNKHEVIHILYAGWPDHFVADSTSICREVRALVLKYYGKKPIVVHCSAGVGRTGTYVAFEMAVQKLKKNEMLVVPDIAKNVRDQRMGAIQNDQQYLFIYRMVVEILIAEQLLTKTPQVMDFIKEYDDLVQRKRIERTKKCLKSSKSSKSRA